MFAEEWPLLMFTLLTQLAVGTYIFLAVIRSLNKRINSEQSLQITKLGMLLIGPVMLLAFVASVFHLGDPFGAYRSLGNLGTSWLSREIIFSGGFFALWIVTFYLDRKGVWNKIVGIITSLVGLMAVYSMASIYATSIKPAWSDVNTYIAFFGSTVLFGAVATMLLVIMSKEEKPEELTGILKGIGVVGLVAIIVQLVYMPVYVAGLSGYGQAGLESASLLTNTYAVSTIIRWALSIVGLALFSILFFRDKISKSQYPLFYTAFVLVLAGEFLGRYIFYATGVPIIVG